MAKLLMLVEKPSFSWLENFGSSGISGNPAKTERKDQERREKKKKIRRKYPCKNPQIICNNLRILLVPESVA